MRRAASNALWELTAKRNAEANRTAGPPSAFDVMFTWTLVSVIAYWSFIKLPGRLKPHLNLVTRSYTSFNDFAWAACYASWSLWMWVAYDVLWRCLCILLLPLPLLVKLQFFDSENTGSGDPAAVLQVTRRAQVLPEGLFELLYSLRSIVLIESDNVAEESRQRDGYLHPLPYRAVVVLTTAWMLAVIAGRVYVHHVRWYRRGLLPEQNLTMKDPTTGEDMPLPPQYAVRVGILPRWLWGDLWGVVFATCFAYVKGLPILTGTVYPVCLCLLLLAEVLMP